MYSEEDTTLETPVTTPDEALAALGVIDGLLDCQQRTQLDEHGYLLLLDALNGDTVEFLRDRLDQIAEEEGELAGSEVHQEEGTVRLANLIDKEPRFDLCWTYAPLLAAVDWVLGGHPFKVNSLNSRAPMPGAGQQHLHCDWGEAVEPDDYQICNSAWLLDDFTPENGATRVVPGSHRWRRRPDGRLADPLGRDTKEVLLLAPAGSCIVFNSHLWHGGTRNHTNRLRHVVHASFVRRHQTQQTVQRDYLRPETKVRLGAAQRYLLDV